MNIYTMGDSIMKFNKYYSYPQVGWAQALNLFTKEDVLIFNHAENGRSTKSFIDEGRFDVILSKLNKGDYVICNFGHNDEKSQDPTRYTRPYVEYKANLKYFKEEVEKRGAHIVYATSVTRHKFKDGVCINSHGEYPAAMLEFAKEENVTCIDLNKITMDYYTKLGEEVTKRFHMIFGPNEYSNYKDGMDDHSHLRFDGATVVAFLFVQALAKTNDSLNECFIDLTKENMIDFNMLKD